MAVEEIHAEMVSSVWKVLVSQGDTVAAGDTLVILESMKMEIPVLTERAGTVQELHLALDDVHLLDGAGVLGEHRDLHLHRLEDHQRVTGGDLSAGLDEDLPHARHHLGVDLLDGHRVSSKSFDVLGHR